MAKEKETKVEEVKAEETVVETAEAPKVDVELMLAAMAEMQETIKKLEEEKAVAKETVTVREALPPLYSIQFEVTNH